MGARKRGRWIHWGEKGRGYEFGKRDKEERLHIRLRGNGGEEDGYVKVTVLLWGFCAAVEI